MAITPDILSRFIPLNSLSSRTLDEVAASAQELLFAPGSVIFREGDVDSRLFFLIEGQIKRHERGKPLRDLAAGEDDARYALARSAKRLYTAEALAPVRIACIEEDLLEGNLCVDQATTYEVFEYDGDDDPGWMWDVLNQPAFRRVPPESLNAMFDRFEKLAGKAGDVIIEQGAAGDYYYLLREGRARITRKSSAGVQTLAEIGNGEGFGEDALLTGDPRNATVTMLTDGLLMRLAKTDFDTLLRAPLVRRVTLKEVEGIILSGGEIQPVDVRLEDEFRAGTMRNSINLPLYLLRLKANALDKGKKYLLFCQNGQRSAAAAFLLAQRGFEVYVLEGGVRGAMAAAAGA